MKKLILLLLTFLFVVNSCNIEKRLYRPGFFVHGKSHVSKPLNVSHEDKKSREKNDKTVQNIPLIEEAKNPNNPNKEIAQNNQVPNNSHKITHKKKSSELNFQTHNYVNHVTNIPPKTRGVEQPVNGLSITKAMDENQNSDAMMYLTALLMGLCVVGLIKGNKSTTTRITRWAKANPKKARGLIAALQLPILGLALHVGYNLKELGVEMSNSLTYIFGSTMALGFLSVPFLATRNPTIIPKVVNRQRIGYLGITLSSFMMMTSIGNNIQDKYPNSLISEAVTRIDHSIFPINETNNGEFSTYDNIQDSIQHERKAAVAMSLAAAIVIIFLLCIVVCAGICIAGFGVAGLIFGISGGEVISVLLGLAGIGLGAIIFWGGIKGIQNVSRKRKETKAEKF